MTPAPGADLTERYQVLRRIARGGMGEIWVARHLELGCEVAAKLVVEELVEPTALARFQREARAAASRVALPRDEATVSLAGASTGNRDGARADVSRPRSPVRWGIASAIVLVAVVTTLLSMEASRSAVDALAASHPHAVGPDAEGHGTQRRRLLGKPGAAAARAVESEALGQTPSWRRSPRK